jgi:hypothetical protein
LELTDVKDRTVWGESVNDCGANLAGAGYHAQDGVVDFEELGEEHQRENGTGEVEHEMEGREQAVVRSRSSRICT